MLEIITREDPYSECGGVVGRIVDRVLHRKLPNSLNRVTHTMAKVFIELCLQYEPGDRPSVAELLQHKFLELSDEDDQEVTIGDNVLITLFSAVLFNDVDSHLLPNPS